MRAECEATVADGLGATATAGNLGDASSLGDSALGVHRSITDVRLADDGPPSVGVERVGGVDGAEPVDCSRSRDCCTR